MNYTVKIIKFNGNFRERNSHSNEKIKREKSVNNKGIKTKYLNMLNSLSFKIKANYFQGKEFMELFDQVTRNLINKIKEALLLLTIKKSICIGEILLSICEECKLLKNNDFTILILGFTAKLFFLLNNFISSLLILRQLRILLLFNEKKNELITLYKYFGKIYLSTGDYTKAKKYLLKFLKHTILFKDAKNQLKCYDLLGKVYFYQNNIEKARLYHNRMLKGQLIINEELYKLIKIHFDKKRLKNKRDVEKREMDTEITSAEESEFEIQDNLPNTPPLSPKSKRKMSPKPKFYEIEFKDLGIKKILPEIYSKNYITNKILKDFEKSPKKIIQFSPPKENGHYLSHLSYNRAEPKENLQQIEFIRKKKYKENDEDKEKEKKWKEFSLRRRIKIEGKLRDFEEILKFLLKIMF